MKLLLNTTLAGTVSALFLAAVAQASPLTFDFKDPKGVNNAQFKLDAPLEAISGTASGISGKVMYDATNPAATQGEIVVEAASLHVPNPMMKDHMHGAQWMDVSSHPAITFKAKEMRGLKTVGDTATGEVVGSLTLRGVTHELIAPVKLTYLKGKLGARTNGRMQGDLLVIRSNFAIKRSDYGINPGAPQDKVAEDIEITLSIAGAAPQK